MSNVISGSSLIAFAHDLGVRACFQIEDLRFAGENAGRPGRIEAVNQRLAGMQKDLKMLKEEVEPDEFLARADVLRERSHLPYLTDEILRKAKTGGRP